RLAGLQLVQRGLFFCCHQGRLQRGARIPGFHWIMSLNRKIVRHPSLEGRTNKANFIERKFDSKTTYFSPVRNPRRISDPGFYRTNNPYGNLQSSSRFPKLVFENGVKKKENGVVNLNTHCERKYRSWSDPNGEFTGDSDISSQTRTFYNDLQATWTLLPRLGKALNTEKDNFEEKSFCDSLSSFPCSSITSRRPSVSTDEEDDSFISKRKTVLSWVHDNDCKGTRIPTRM
ncbi:hypothetical protein ACROYT_G020165, partial [Oculina patagonica]